MPKAEAASKFELRVLYPVSPLSLLPTCPWGQGEDHRVPLVSCPDFAGCIGLSAIFAAVCIILHFIETLSHAFWPTASIGGPETKALGLAVSLPIHQALSPPKIPRS